MPALKNRNALFENSQPPIQQPKHDRHLQNETINDGTEFYEKQNRNSAKKKKEKKKQSLSRKVNGNKLIENGQAHETYN